MKYYWGLLDKGICFACREKIPHVKLTYSLPKTATDLEREEQQEQFNVIKHLETHLKDGWKLLEDHKESIIIRNLTNNLRVRSFIDFLEQPVSETTTSTFDSKSPILSWPDYGILK